MWGGGGTGGSGGGGGLDPSALAGYASMGWVEDNYISKAFWTELFIIHGMETVYTSDDDGQTWTQDGDPTSIIFSPNEVPSEVIEDGETEGTKVKTVRTITSIEAKKGVWTNSYISALGQNSSGGGGGGGSTTLYGLLDVNIPATLTQANDGQVLMYNYAQNKWINATIQQSGGTVTSITAGTGLSGGTITGSGTIAIDSTYQTYISHGETAYGWGNHATAGYMTQSAGDNRYLKIDFFRSLFRAYTSGNTEVTPNAGDTSTIDNIKAMFGFWTNAYISALGQNSSGGGGGGGSSTLAGLNDVQLGTLSADDVLIYDGTGHWINTSKSSFLSGYVTTSDISDMATKTWVQNQRYITGISSSDVTTALGYTPLSNATTFWGQSVSNGAVSGSLTNVGNITSSTVGSIINFNAIEFAATGTAESGNGGALYFHFPGVSGYSSAYILEEEEGVIALHGKLKIGSAYIEWDSTNSCLKISSGLYSNSFISALGLNSSGGGGGGSTTLYGLLDVNIPAVLTQANDGQVLMYNYTQNKWVNATIQQSGGTVTSITAGTGLSGGTITGSGTIAINSTYQTYISHGETAYGWGNHADAGYLTASAISDMATKTWVTNQGYTTNVGTVTSIIAGTGLSGGTITGSGTIAIDSTYQTHISHGETAYGWGNHADAGYWKSSNHPTTLSGYAITDAVNSSTTFWGQSVSSGAVKGSIYAGSDGGIIDGFHSIELNSNGTLSGYGGFIDFHFNGSSSDYTSRIIEDANGRLFMDADNGVRIGDAVLKWDSTNNALYVQRSDGSAVNLYATGGVSALGMSAGTSSVDAMTFNYVTINNQLTLKNNANSGSVYIDGSGVMCIAPPDSRGTVSITGNKLNTEGGNIYTEGGTIDTDGGDIYAGRYYLDTTRYLYVSSGTLYYYNGSTSKQVAFTN